SCDDPDECEDGTTDYVDCEESDLCIRERTCVEGGWQKGPAESFSIAAGGGHTCALRGNGRVICWGQNKYGELGDGTTGDSTKPVEVSGLDDAVAVSAGDYDVSDNYGGSHTCALREGGKVSCWGRNDYGQLGDGSNDDSLEPVEV